MTDDMVERVKQVLLAEMSGPPGRHEVIRRNREIVAGNYARAAISAMREPTEAMLLAASREVVSEAKWRAMIDAALGERR